jgi:heme-degrading monooxygenase HmoA
MTPGAQTDSWRKRLFVRIWQFRVDPEQADEFGEIYGPRGAWARLFRREIGFHGTQLLQSVTDPNTYITIDSWESAEAWAAFLRAWGDDYAVLDRRCTALFIDENEIGNFESADARLPSPD